MLVLEHRILLNPYQDGIGIADLVLSNFSHAYNGHRQDDLNGESNLL